MSDSQQTQQNQTNNSTTNQQAQKPKKTRTRKTIDQELAELDARRQRLLESKRREEAHAKIVFGATVISMLKDMRKKGDEEGKKFSEKLLKFANDEKEKDRIAIEKIIAQISEIKPDVKPNQQGHDQENKQEHQQEQKPEQQEQKHAEQGQKSENQRPEEHHKQQEQMQHQNQNQQHQQGQSQQHQGQHKQQQIHVHLQHKQTPDKQQQKV